MDIKGFIEQQLPKGVSVTQSIGGDTGGMGLHGVAGEFANMQQMGTGGAIAQTVAKQGQKLAQQHAQAAVLGLDDQL